MNNKRKDILSFLQEKKDQEALLSYLEGRLGREEREAFERKTAADPFLQDALEGLSGMNSSRLNRIRRDLSKNLSNHLRKKRRRAGSIKPGLWIFFALMILLLLIIAGFLVISRI